MSDPATPTAIPAAPALAARVRTVLAETPRDDLLRSSPEIERIPARHPGFGDLVVRCEADGLVVEFGAFTHSHYPFDMYDTGAGPEAAVARTCEAVVAKLQATVADELEFFGGPAARGGGCRKRGTRTWFDRLLFGKRSWLWSGPVGG